jgi:hypothetical protein
MKRIGVLGGMSAQATMDFEARADLVNPVALLAEAAVRRAISAEC